MNRQTRRTGTFTVAPEHQRCRVRRHGLPQRNHRPMPWPGAGRQNAVCPTPCTSGRDRTVRSHHLMVRSVPMTEVGIMGQVRHERTSHHDPSIACAATHERLRRPSGRHSGARRLRAPGPGKSRGAPPRRRRSGANTRWWRP
jgi:hypothetical protein